MCILTTFCNITVKDAECLACHCFFLQYSDTGYWPQLTSETLHCVEALFRCVKVQCNVVKTCFYYVGEQLNFPLNIHGCF